MAVAAAEAGATGLIVWMLCQPALAATADTWLPPLTLIKTLNRACLADTASLSPITLPSAQDVTALLRRLPRPIPDALLRALTPAWRGACLATDGLPLVRIFISAAGLDGADPTHVSDDQRRWLMSGVRASCDRNDVELADVLQNEARPGADVVHHPAACLLQGSIRAGALASLRRWHKYAPLTAAGLEPPNKFLLRLAATYGHLSLLQWLLETFEISVTSAFGADVAATFEMAGSAALGGDAGTAALVRR